VGGWEDPSFKDLLNSATWANPSPAGKSAAAQHLRSARAPRSAPHLPLQKGGARRLPGPRKVKSSQRRRRRRAARWQNWRCSRAVAVPWAWAPRVLPGVGAISHTWRVLLCRRLLQWQPWGGDGDWRSFMFLNFHPGWVPSTRFVSVATIVFIRDCIVPHSPAPLTVPVAGEGGPSADIIRPLADLPSPSAVPPNVA
jgi:hypothetical protein